MCNATGRRTCDITPKLVMFLFDDMLSILPGAVAKYWRIYFVNKENLTLDPYWAGNDMNVNRTTVNCTLRVYIKNWTNTLLYSYAYHTGTILTTIRSHRYASTRAHTHPYKHTHTYIHACVYSRTHSKLSGDFTLINTHIVYTTLYRYQFITVFIILFWIHINFLF